MTRKLSKSLPKRGHRGFTLIELIVVIAVIGILAGIAVVILNGIQVSARNAQRKSDLAQLRDAVRQYHLVTGQWPVTAGNPQADILTACGDWPADIKSEFASVGIYNLPKDPLFNGGSKAGNGNCDTGSLTHLYYSMGCLTNVQTANQCKDKNGTVHPIECHGKFAVEIHLEGDNPNDYDNNTSDPDYGKHCVCGWDGRHYNMVVGDDPACQ